MISQQTRSQKQSKVSYPFSKNIQSKPIELQVNINIGRSKFVLQVQKCSNLHQQVSQFLHTNNISLKYQAPILAMVRQQLSKKKQQSEKLARENEEQVQQLKKVKDQIQKKKQRLYEYEKEQEQQFITQNQQLWSCKEDNNDSRFSRTIENKQNYSTPLNINKFNNTNQSTNLNRIQRQSQNRSEDKCQNLYEKWKAKQKIKQSQKVKKSETNQKQRKQKSSNVSFVKQKQKNYYKTRNSLSTNKLQIHSPDYFYNKGVKFNQAKQIHIQHLYKQQYPFQLNRNCSLTPKQKNDLHHRLYRQNEVKEVARIKKQISQRQIVKPKPVCDKYKMKVIQRDNKINKALQYLLENKMIQNPCKIQNVAKSPFRRTQAY